MCSEIINRIVLFSDLSIKKPLLFKLNLDYCNQEKEGGILSSSSEI